MKNKINLGTFLKALRLNSNYTQQEVADLLGISKTAYINYETDLREPPFRIMLKIKQIYNLDLNELSNNILENKLLDINKNLSKEDLQLFAINQKFKNLDEDIQNFIYELVIKISDEDNEELKEKVKTKYLLDIDKFIKKEESELDEIEKLLNRLEPLKDLFERFHNELIEYKNLNNKGK